MGPKNISNSAKALIGKFTDRLIETEHRYRSAVEKTIKLLRNSLKSEDDTLPYFVCYFFAQMFPFMTNYESGFVSDAKLDKASVSLEKYRKKARHDQIKMGKLDSQVNKSAEVIQKWFESLNLKFIDRGNFPTQNFVRVIESANDASSLILKTWFIDVLVHGTVDKASFEMATRSNALSKFIVLVEAKMSFDTETVVAFSKLCSSFCKSRATLKKAIEKHQIDIMLVSLFNIYPKLEELKMAIVDMTESLVCCQGAVLPLHTIINKSGHLLLKCYQEMLSKARCMVLTHRNYTVIITLLLYGKIDISECEQSFVGSFLAKLTESMREETEANSKLIFYLRWTLDMLIMDEKGLVSDEQKAFFSKKMTNLLQKL